MRKNELALKKFPTSRAEQSALAEQFISTVIEGEVSPIDAVVKMRSLNEAINQFLKDNRIVDSVVTECEKYNTKKGEFAQYCGAKVTVKETGTKYDFSCCGDIIWDNLQSQIETLTEQRKEREKYLKVVPAGKIEVDAETGETWEIRPPVRSSTTTYSVTYLKE